MNLQEANLRSVRIQSDDPLHISSHSDESFPSFVAAPGVTRPAVNSTAGEAGDDVRVLAKEETYSSAGQSPNAPEEYSHEGAACMAMGAATYGIEV